MSTQTGKVQITDAEEVFAALEKFINQRPNVDPNNYFSPYDRGANLVNGRNAYRSELRDIAKDRKRALAALDTARGLQPGRCDVLADSLRAYSGRLQWNNGDDITANPCHERGLYYYAGQYYSTEYRKAAASVLETYIAAWKQAENAANPKTFTYRDIDRK